MSREHDSAQEPTEPPGERKLRQARSEGQVPRSKELVMACQLLLFTLTLLALTPDIPDSLVKLCNLTLQLYSQEVSDTGYLFNRLQIAGSTLVRFAIPLFALTTIAAIAGSLMTGGLVFAPKAARPKLERISPLAGLKRLFSAQTLAELIKAILKTAALVTILLVFVRCELPTMMGRRAAGATPSR